MGELLALGIVYLIVFSIYTYIRVSRDLSRRHNRYMDDCGKVTYERVESYEELRARILKERAAKE